MNHEFPGKGPDHSQVTREIARANIEKLAQELQTTVAELVSLIQNNKDDKVISDILADVIPKTRQIAVAEIIEKMRSQILTIESINQDLGTEDSDVK